MWQEKGCHNLEGKGRSLEGGSVYGVPLPNRSRNVRRGARSLGGGPTVQLRWSRAPKGCHRKIQQQHSKTPTTVMKDRTLLKAIFEAASSPV
jgi:hypothetical protein